MVGHKLKSESLDADDSYRPRLGEIEPCATHRAPNSFQLAFGYTMESRSNSVSPCGTNRANQCGGFTHGPHCCQNSQESNGIRMVLYMSPPLVPFHIQRNPFHQIWCRVTADSCLLFSAQLNRLSIMHTYLTENKFAPTGICMRSSFAPQ